MVASSASLVFRVAQHGAVSLSLYVVLIGICTCVYVYLGLDVCVCLLEAAARREGGGGGEKATHREKISRMGERERGLVGSSSPLVSVNLPMLLPLDATTTAYPPIQGEKNSIFEGWRRATGSEVYLYARLVLIRVVPLSLIPPPSALHAWLGAPFSCPSHCCFALPNAATNLRVLNYHHPALSCNALPMHAQAYLISGLADRDGSGVGHVCSPHCSLRDGRIKSFCLSPRFPLPASLLIHPTSSHSSIALSLSSSCHVFTWLMSSLSLEAI